ncbi:sugar phosphate isomerase/epimerase family protein [Gibbsiella quercinecans]|uniref:sugar phosphate isomerase/epimerase family protein n=1 Tax=Gibbsiella quercinecans TaxID=929813 RepID=UPI003A4E131A
MRELKGRRDLLAINTATLGYQQPLDQTIHLLAEAGIGGIAPWRQEVDALGVQRAAALIRAAGLTVTGYCRSHYFTAASRQAREQALAINLRALDDAAELGAQCYVLVVGGLSADNTALPAVCDQALEGVMRLAEHARQCGVPLALEPLHPMYCAERSCLVTLAQAIQWCRQINHEYPASAGIAADAYHLWWSPTLEEDLLQAGELLLACHVSDWLVPTRDMLNDRGMMGDGVIALPAFRAQVEKAGYGGLIEVEIFSRDNWWLRPPAETLATCITRFESVV